jgi:hypothetical protein
MPAYTWTTGETITAAKLQALEDEAWRVANLLASGSSTSDTTTTSTSYVDAAASVTFTAKSSSVYAQISGGGAFAGSTLSRLGINLNGTDYDVSHMNNSFSSTGPVPFCGGIVVTGLSPGTSYTAKLRIKSFHGFNVGVNSDGWSRQTITIWDISK